MRASGIPAKFIPRRGASGLKMTSAYKGLRGDSFSNGNQDMFKRNSSMNYKN